MNKGIRFTDEFKQDAVAQVVERSYAFSEVAERLGISAKSLYTWKGQFSKPPRVRAEVLDQAAEIKRLKRELARVTEERNILKKRPRTSRKNISEVRVYRGSSDRVFGAFHVPDVDGAFQWFLHMAKGTARLSWA
jgi:transposase